MRSPRRRHGEATRAVHTPAFTPPTQRPLGLPVYRSAAFAFDSAAEYADVLADRTPGFSYSRIDNPTAMAFAQAVAALEGANVDADVTGEPFGSGMAAVSTVLMTLCRAGSHVVAAREGYGGTYGLLTRVLRRFGVSTDFVDVADVEAVRAAVRPETALIWVETLANPAMSVTDLPAVAAVARDAGVALAVDSTFASPALCRPLEHGATVVVHSATKYIGGHSDAMGGVVVGPADTMAAVRATRVDLGGVLSPDEAFLLHRGLATLPLRMDRHCANALTVARAVAEHPRVVGVDYPGLSTHRHHERARRLFDVGPDGTRFGGVVTVTPAGGREAGMALCDALQVVDVATSLGGAHSKAGHVATTSHRQLDDAALAAAGIDPGAVRFSIGLEDAEDLVADVVGALDGLG